MPEGSPVTYWDYIKVNELLRLQTGRGDEEISNDELHFIIVHQVFELWFKLMIRELRDIRDRLAKEEVPERMIPPIVAGLSRVVAIWSTAIDHWSVVETLDSQGFLEFRDKLRPASGFQSDQLRAIELLLGLDEGERQRLFPPKAGRRPFWDRIVEEAAESGEGGRAVAARLREVQADIDAHGSVREALERWLYRTPIRGKRFGEPGDRAEVEGFIRDYLARIEEAGEATFRYVADADRAEHRERIDDELAEARAFLAAEDRPEPERERVRRVRAAILFIETYRHLPLLSWPRTLLASLVEMEQSFLFWRTRHARMVERMIGRRVGTGGSPGVDYLDRTTSFRIFPDLWAARRFLVPRAHWPELGGEVESFYEYRSADGA